MHMHLMQTPLALEYLAIVGTRDRMAHLCEDLGRGH